MHCSIHLLSQSFRSRHSSCGATFSARITHVELIAAALRRSRTLKNAILTCHFLSFSCRHTLTHAPKRQRLLSPLSSGGSFIVLFNYFLCLLVKKAENSTCKSAFTQRQVIFEYIYCLILAFFFSFLLVE